MSSLPLPHVDARRPRAPRPLDAIEAYIRAKDGNRPHLMDTAFAEDARLRMHLRTDAIAFPPEVHGRQAITQTLVRQFNQAWENVHTFCLGRPPVADAVEFSCDWLVVMSSKNDGSLRVGCGRYDWSFERVGRRVLALDITIEAMEVAACDIAPVMDWANAQPWPWCARSALRVGAPPQDELQAVLDRLQVPPA